MKYAILVCNRNGAVVIDAETDDPRLALDLYGRLNGRADRCLPPLVTGATVSIFRRDGRERADDAPISLEDLLADAYGAVS